MDRLMGLRPVPATLSTVLAVLVSLVPVAADSGVELGQPSSSGAFGETVVFGTTLTADRPPDRVELLARTPGESSDGISIAQLEPAGDGWEARAFQGGHIVPNTSWEFRFRAVTGDEVVVGPSATHRVVDERFDWRSLEGPRVRVWWYEGDEAFAQRALDIAEAAVASAAELLGVSDIEPVDFFIYADTRAFREAMGPATRENVGGQAHPSIRTLFGLIEPRQIDSDWVEELVTHELAHLVFHEAVDNPYQYPPRWLNEGLAVYLSKGYDGGDRAQVEGAARGGTIIPLEGLGGQFPTRPGRQSLAYAESIAAVDHFVETYGEPALVALIGAFGRGRGLDDAFLDATGSDFAAFDAAWLASLGADPPEPYGPQAGQPGPVPEAWLEEEPASAALLR